MGFKNYIGQMAADKQMEMFPDVPHDSLCHHRENCVDFLSDPFRQILKSWRMIWENLFLEVFPKERELCRLSTITTARAPNLGQFHTPRCHLSDIILSEIIRD